MTVETGLASLSKSYNVNLFRIGKIILRTDDTNFFSKIMKITTKVLSILIN
jgi:hypothetical protein